MTRVTRIVTSSQDKFARKYCFRARTQLANPPAVITGYDITPRIASEVRIVAERLCESPETRDSVELVLFAECPVELSDEIQVHLLE